MQVGCMQAPKKYEIKPSGIDGSGLGLYLLERAEKDERIVSYSGDELNAVQTFFSDSDYVL